MIANIVHLKEVIGTHRISFNRAMNKTFHHQDKKK